MCNSIFINKNTLPKAKDGEEYEAKIKGIYRTDEDGIRKFEVTSFDGKDVVSPDEAESDCGCGEDHEDLMNQTSDDALRLFVIKMKKGK